MPASSYSAAVSELHRRRGFQTDRASMRRWALQHNQAPNPNAQPLVLLHGPVF
jgi:hypothetical protein